MTRKISFDYQQALASATDLFWKNGYAATGLRDLLKVMGIGEGSFYNTLKSKKQLYLACVERYNEEVVGKREQALLAAPTAALGIRAFFADVLDSLDNPQTPSRLCLLAAMETEEVLVDDELRLRAEQALADLKAMFALRLAEDRERGELPASLDPQLNAAIIATYLKGLWRMALVEYERPAFERQIDAFLTALGL
ncbi:TetR/AcrR family transcriptional regulator [Pseudomonas putida]|uniref:TetR/AcrR family transcriptional regulator n=1 Tax=Pseudomonas TaxID=286 RepID=UPI0007B6B025|nr:TetR/AcrR family transcriptional regulator [Pseudomonas putida]ANC05221.1 TetR family transcriptional regulator [Pseudomonas putida]